MVSNMKTIKLLFPLFLLVSILTAACQPILTTATHSPTPITTLTSTTPTHTLVPTATSQPTLTVDLAALRGKLVKVAHPWGMDKSSFDQLIGEFNLSNAWGIQAVATAYAGDDQLSDAVQRADLDANVLIGQTYNLLNPQNKTALLELNHYIADPIWGVLDTYLAGSPFEPFAPKPNDPLPQTALPLAYNAGLIFYNATWAEKLGFTADPMAWSDFVSQMQAALRANLNDDNYVNNGTGGLLLSKSVLSAQSWYTAFGGSYSLENQALMLQDEVLDKSFKALKQAFQDDTSWVGLEPTPYQYFVDRFALAYEGALSDLITQVNYQPEKTSESSWKTLPYPTEDGKGSIALESLSAGIVPRDADSDLAAWLFVRWLLQPAQQVRLVELTGLWPATGQPAQIAPDYAERHPAWASALKADARLTLAPEKASWGINRYVLQDAYLRVYGLEPQYFHSIIDVLKQTLVMP